MNTLLYKMLLSSEEADRAKSVLSLDLLGKNAVGIGDHSTGDFYKSAEEALRMLIDADGRIEILKNEFLQMTQLNG